MATTRSLKTDWKRIGRSGATTDGRTIDPQMLLDAAETYDKDTFTALIWPDHYHWINYGLVEELKAEKNSDGGVDLLAILSPNQMYLQSNSLGQRLFLSMELMNDFAKTGKTYLTGLAATDDPASLGTSEMRFSADSKKVGVFLSQPQEIDLAENADGKADDAEALNLFRRMSALFSKSPSQEDDDMADKAALEKLQTELADLKAEFTKLKPAESKPDDKAQDKPEDALTKLSTQVTELAARFEEFSTGQTKSEGDAITKLSQKVDSLSATLATALAEQPGTKDGSEGGDGDFEAAGKFAEIY